MPFVHEIQIVSTGFPGAPGFTNLYFETTVGADHDAQFTAVRSFLEAIADTFPEMWSAQIRPEGRLLEAATGTLAAFTTVPSASAGVKVGTGGPFFGAGVAGAVISWSTATIGPRRLIRGKSFLVPLESRQWQADGKLTAVCLGKLNVAAVNLIASAVGFCIWHRPVGGSGGSIAPVVSHHITNQAAFLTSRRV